MCRAARRAYVGCMANQRASGRHAAFGRDFKTRPIDPDATTQWGCSMKGWNCCVDKGIAVRPYDMIRLRHALGRPSLEIVNDDIVQFAWHPSSGILVGSLPQRPYGNGQVACTYLDVVTNVSAREMREADPERFATMPQPVQRAAGSTASGEWDVAGLCRIHDARPEVCRGLPFQRVATAAPDGSPDSIEVHAVFRCGSCALSTATTPRDVLAGESIDEFWRARHAMRQVEAYLRSIGIANVSHPYYRAFPADEVARLWTLMYLPDEDEAIAAKFPEQWREPADIEGDRQIHRRVMERTLERAGELIAASGEPAAAWGPRDAESERPDLDAALDPQLDMLPLAERAA